LYKRSCEGVNSWTPAKFKLTLRTAASSRTFKRKVTLWELMPERRVDEKGDFVMTGRYYMDGMIGDWDFCGFYDPQTRTGTLTEKLFIPEE
jgi:hypothetical protein